MAVALFLPYFRHILVLRLNMANRGNALFLILIAVALFAALSYAVTQSGRGGGSIDREQMTLSASQMMDYGAIMQQTIQRLRILNGCTENDISFERSPFDGVTDPDYVNSVSTVTDFSCHVFHPNGGGLDFATPPNSVNDGSDYTFAGTLRIGEVGNNGDGDLLFSLANVDIEFCRAYNNLANNDFTQNPPQDMHLGDILATFDGNYVSGGRIISNPAHNLDGQTQACFEGGTTSPPAGTYHAYFVLIER